MFCMSYVHCIINYVIEKVVSEDPIHKTQADDINSLEKHCYINWLIELDENFQGFHELFKLKFALLVLHECSC